MLGRPGDPPVLELASGALLLVVIGGIYQVAHLPKRVPLTLPWILLAAAAVLLVVAGGFIHRIEGFAWKRFATVGKWVLLAYAVTAGMLEYVFIRNDTRGASLVVLTLSLVVYWLTVPLLIAYTVARFVPRD